MPLAMSSRSINKADTSSSQTKAPQRPRKSTGPPAPSISPCETTTSSGVPCSPSSGRTGRYKQLLGESPTVTHISSRARSPATPSTSEDPATELADEDESGDEAEASIGERELVAILRKVDKKSRRSHTKYSAMKDNVDNTSERILRLEDSYASLMDQMGELETLCNADDLDEVAIDKLFQAIPRNQRQ